MRPVPADVLEVRHHDERVTTYRQVRYWPWRDGVTVYDRDGAVEVASHADVLEVFATNAARS